MVRNVAIGAAGVTFYGLLALSLTLVAGTIGLISLGHAALLAIGAYASALIAMRAGWPVWASVPAAGIVTMLRTV